MCVKGRGGGRQSRLRTSSVRASRIYLRRITSGKESAPYLRVDILIFRLGSVVIVITHWRRVNFPPPARKRDKLLFPSPQGVSFTSKLQRNFSLLWQCQMLSCRWVRCLRFHRLRHNGIGESTLKDWQSQKRMVICWWFPGHWRALSLLWLYTHSFTGL